MKLRVTYRQTQISVVEIYDESAQNLRLRLATTEGVVMVELSNPPPPGQVTEILKIEEVKE